MRKITALTAIAMLMCVAPVFAQRPPNETPETPKDIKRLVPPVNPVKPPPIGTPVGTPQQPALSPSEQLMKEVTTLLQYNRFDEAELRCKIALLKDANDPVAQSLLKKVQDVKSEVLGRALRQKMSEMMIEEVNFTGAPINAVVEYLQDETKNLSGTGKPINIILNVPPGVENSPVTLKLRNVPLLDVLKYACEAAKVSFRVDQHAVVISEATADSPLPVPLPPPR